MMMNTIILPVIAGLVLFLFGMKLMETALQSWAGPRLQLWLERFTRTPVRGLVTGTVLTAALQSSTAITVIAIGLVGAGVLTFPRTLGVILGTNIGTCLTTELIGLSLGGIGVPILLVSAAIWMASWLAGPLPPSAARGQEPADSAGGREWLRSVRYGALAVAGFSLVLLGIEIMQTIGPALQSRGLFAWFVTEAKQSLLWGIIAGAAVTALVHSSAAVIAMAMGLAAIQGIPVELGIAITIGANVGTCVTALIAGMSSSRAGRYVAWSHILLNVGGAILFYPFIHQLVSLSALIADDASSQIARSQTIFNVVCSLIALPFCYLNMWKRLEFRSQ
ncbi:Na/Pi symporter [Paenibacillus anseongense]|uniref:Na/Pi cotransporter family protein n=1 Tax=Paenibacillus TaxID=44249 RepID=UPI002DBB6B00|nr:Na/Pi symporter [Paenibacillus anseongense]